jgi:hypothetical protein
MTDANAYDPSTWGSDADAPEGSTPGGGVGANDASLPVDGEPYAVTLEDLYARASDLRQLIGSTTSQRDKAQVTADAAQAEIDRLIALLERVELDIDSRPDEDEG